MGDEGKDDPLALSGSEYRDKEQESIAVTHVLDTKSLVNDTTLASKRKSDESINDDPKLALVEDDHKTSILDDTSNSSPKVKNAKIGGDISKTATHADTPNTAGNDVTGDDDAIPVNVTGPTATSGKKISAKELVQHVKNQKKKIQDQEAEIGKLSAQFGICRMRALAMAIDLVSAASTKKKSIRAFHKWLAFAERESAAIEVERVAGLAHRATTELETIKIELDSARKEKSDLETLQKKLRALLARAKQQLADQAKAHEQTPENFSLTDVSRKVRAPDGAVFCLVAMRKGEADKTSYEWREEAIVISWLAAKGLGEESLLREHATVEEELQERYSRASREMESALCDKQLELDTLTDRFEQYRRRAELALEKAGSDSREKDPAAESALRDELSRIARERDAHAEKVEELRGLLDAAESVLAASRVREKMLREERDELERRASEASRAMEAARAAWEQTLKRFESDAEERSQAERAETRAAIDRADALERSLQQVKQAEAEAKSAERQAVDSLSKAEDRIEGLRAALARAEAKANSAELSRHLAASSSLSVAAPPMANSSSRQGSVMSTLSSPRPSQSGKALDTVYEVGDSASVADIARQRRDSGDSEFSASLAPGAEVGPKYFVDQIGALRAAHRNERVDWQRERSTLREQIDDAVLKKQQAEDRAIQLERTITEMKLASERQRQLSESARTVGETPDGLLYLKNAVFRFITADADSERETLLPVITMLLKFTPEEVQVLQGETSRSHPGNGLLGGIFSRFS